MTHMYTSPHSLLAALVVPLALAITFSGCTLLGLGAAAGTVVGGCAILDQNEDERITEAEFSSGLFNAWDTNNNGALTEAEFEAGISRSDTFADWSGEFSAWDTNNNGTLSRAEFEAGVTAGDTSQWLDRRCDELGL